MAIVIYLIGSIISTSNKQSEVIILSNIYGHEDDNFEVEEMRMPQVISLLEYIYPEVQYKVFKSYTKTDRTNEKIQKNGIDIIYRPTPTSIYRCADAKGYRREYFTAVLIEVEAGYIFQKGLTKADKGKRVPADKVTDKRPGWYKFKPCDYKQASFTSPYQADIIQVSEYEGIIINKGDLARTIDKYPWLLSDKGTYWTIDYGNDDDNFKSGNIIVKRNRLLYLNNKYHIRMLLEMNAKKYHLVGNRWRQVGIDANY